MTQDGKYTITIEGETYQLTQGGQAPSVDGLIGYVKAYITDERGIRYIVINPHVRGATIFSAVDTFKGYISLVGYVDKMAREIERLTQELLDLRAQIEPDALGHITNGGEQNE
jgi:hypothetical protein